MSEDKRFFSILFFIIIVFLYYFYNVLVTGMGNNMYSSDYSIFTKEVLINSLDDRHFDSLKEIRSAQPYCAYDAYFLKKCIGIVIPNDLVENREIYDLITMIIKNPCDYMNIRSSPDASFSIRGKNYPYTIFYCSDNSKTRMNVGFFIVEDNFGEFDYKIDLKKES